MSFDILALAEGVANDGRGALTLVGVNQRVIVASTAPFHIKQRLLAAFSDEVIESSQPEFGPIPNGIVTVKVFDPSGSAIFAASEEIDVTEGKQWLDLPLVVNVIMDVDIRGDAYGIYMIEVTHSSSNSEPLTRRLPVYVVEPKILVGSGRDSRHAFSSDS